MAEQVVKNLARHRDPELGGVGPVDLDKRPWFKHLREKHFLGRTVVPTPRLHPALERAQGARGQADVFGPEFGQQVREERLGFQLGAFFEEPLGLGPELGHRIGPARTPRLGGLTRAVALLDVLGGRMPVHARLHGGLPHVGRVFLCLHESLILVLGNHWACLRPRASPQRRPAPF